MKATAGALAASAGPKPRLVYVVTEDWSFVTHFLPMARAARDAGFEVVVVTRVQEHRAAIEEEGFRLVNLGADRSTFDPLKLLRVEPGLAPSAPVLQRAQTALLDKGRPAGYRLAMHADAAGHLGLRKAFLQQPDAPESAGL